MEKKIDGPNGPVEVELKVHIINDKTEQRGVATIGMGFGVYPSPQEIAERIKTFEGELSEMAAGFRLQTAEELWDTACLEKAGQKFATPAAWQAFRPIE